MLIRLTLTFTAHLVAGIAFGALAATAASAIRRGEHDSVVLADDVATASVQNLDNDDD